MYCIYLYLNIYIFLTYIVLTIPYSFNTHFFKTAQSVFLLLKIFKNGSKERINDLPTRFPELHCQMVDFPLKNIHTYTHANTQKSGVSHNAF